MKYTCPKCGSNSVMKGYRNTITKGVMWLYCGSCQNETEHINKYNKEAINNIAKEWKEREA